MLCASICTSMKNIHNFIPSIEGFMGARGAVKPKSSIDIARRAISTDDDLREEFVDIFISRIMANIENIVKKRDAELAEILAEQKLAKVERKELRDGQRDLQERLGRAEQQIEDNRREYHEEIRGLKARLFGTTYPLKNCYSQNIPRREEASRM